MEIDFLLNHPSVIPDLAQIWCDVLGNIWLPDVSIDHVIQRLNDHLSSDKLPITFAAFDGDKPVGMCSLRANDGIRPDLTPWLGSLVVNRHYQRKGIGRILIDRTKQTARDLGFKNLYLFAFDPTIPDYYNRLGWKKIGMDEFKMHPVTVMETVIL